MRPLPPIAFDSSVIASPRNSFGSAELGFCVPASSAVGATMSFFPSPLMSPTAALLMLSAPVSFSAGTFRRRGKPGSDFAVLPSHAYRCWSSPGSVMSSRPSPFRSPSVGDEKKPRFTWLSFEMSAGFEKFGSRRTGKPFSGLPSACQAYTCSPAESTMSGSMSPSTSPIAGVRRTSRGAPMPLLMTPAPVCALKYTPDRTGLPPLKLFSGVPSSAKTCSAPLESACTMSSLLSPSRSYRRWAASPPVPVFVA